MLNTPNAPSTLTLRPPLRAARPIETRPHFPPSLLREGAGGGCAARTCPTTRAASNRSYGRIRNRLVLLLAVAFLALLAFPDPAGAQPAAQLRQLELLKSDHAKLHAQFASDMLQLAEQVEQLSFIADAARIRTRAKPVEEGAYDLDDLPLEIIPDVPLTLPEAEKSWRIKLQKLERDYAVDLYRLARRAVDQGHPSLVFQWVRETAFHDPNHNVARKLLGYVRDGQSWTTPFARRMKARRFVDDPTFGWIAAADLPRYQNGERKVGAAWVSAEKEAAFRSDFNNAWEIESEHFLVKTNVSREEGVRVARALERFHKFFLREMSAFFTSPQQLRSLLNTGSGSGSSSRDPYAVYYFRNKVEFDEFLRTRQPNISIANGLYRPADRTAYFFHVDDERERKTALGTMYHEVTHQLLSESIAQPVDVGVGSDFWAVEAIACYFESFDPDGDPKVGSPRDLRLAWAREYVVNENEFVPMARLTSYSLQAFPKEHREYAQSAGMAHFFLNYQDGLYRDQFLEYLTMIYSPNIKTRSRPTSLAELTGVPFETLDQQYRDYIASLPCPSPAELQAAK